MSKTDLAFWLGLYAAAIASATGLWTLFRELWLERARLDVDTYEAWSVAQPGQARPLIVKGEDTLKTMAVPDSARKQVLIVNVRNRGRRDATIEAVGQARGSAWHITLFRDLMPQVPFEIAAERSHQLKIGPGSEYAHGKVPVEGFFVVDGAGRVHPLSERLRRRVARLLRRSRSTLPSA